MWIFTRYGFFSIACAKGSDYLLMIRTRNRQHLEILQAAFEDLIGKHQIVEHSHTDYPYRIFVIKPDWEKVMLRLIQEQTWSNFKDEVQRYSTDDGEYLHSLHNVWQEMLNYQLDLENGWEEEEKGVEETVEGSD